MREFVMSIGGAAAVAQEKHGVVDPAAGEVFAQAPVCSREQLDQAMAAAQAAAGWGQDDGARVAALQAAADAVAAARDDLAVVLSREQGKPLQAAQFEVAETARWLSAAAALEIPREIVQDDERGYAVVERRPLGVVAAITPWNFPLLLAGWKLGPALRAGNTVVLKPSPFTPLSSLALGEVLNQVLPAGVVNVVSGGDELGAWMTQHPTVRKISFTGSVETGKLIAAAAAPDLKRFTLELGGNDAAIVLPDADVESIGRRLFWAAFINNGQICAGIKRVLVAEALHDDLVECLAELARKVRVGAGTEPRVQLGPVGTGGVQLAAGPLPVTAMMVGNRPQASPSSVMACSGQLSTTSSARSACSGETVPSPAAEANPSSSMSKRAGASATQRLWPWHNAGSTWTFIGIPSRRPAEVPASAAGASFYVIRD
jgi:acyl-CoA reductase-like NAD-dependent aldehyde dehydrogenase